MFAENSSTSKKCKEAKTEEALQNEKDFLIEEKCLSALRINKLSNKIPTYKYKRFANACDVRKTFPKEDTYSILNREVKNFWLEHNIDQIPNKEFKNLLTMVKKRFHKQISQPSPEMSHCSPWLAKKIPLSVKNGRSSPLESKIYFGVTIYHSSNKYFVVVQEAGEDQIGYMPPIFAAKATIAFPPICEGEVWTVGWVQTLTSFSNIRSYGQNFKLVYCFKDVTKNFVLN